MVKNQLILFFWIFMVLSVSCSGDTDFQVETYNLPEYSSLEASELFRISSPVEGVFFSDIKNIHILAEGNLVVQNYPDHQLYELNADGELINVIGRQGHGPGEFVETYITHLTSKDSLHVYDFNNARHQVLVKNKTGEWEYARDRVFRRLAREGMVEQVPRALVSGPDSAYYGIFRIFPGARDTLNAHYNYVALVDENIEHTGEVGRLRLTDDLAIHRGDNNSITVSNNRRFFSMFYRYDPVRDNVIAIKNNSNKIIAIDSTNHETVIGYLPYERFLLNREKVGESLGNVNFYYSGMGELVRDKLLEHEPYYRNVILHENRLWVNLARSENSPNWVITYLDGEVLDAFRGPDQISEVTVNGNRMYGSVRDADGEVYLVGYKLTRR